LVVKAPSGHPKSFHSSRIFPFTYISEFRLLTDKNSRDKITKLEVSDTKQQSQVEFSQAKMFLLAGKIVHDTIAGTMANAGE
jgi:hypothetical protein